MTIDSIATQSSLNGFVAGTLIRVPRDNTLPHTIWKAIEDIQIGDMVLARSEHDTTAEHFVPVKHIHLQASQALWVMKVLELIEDFSNNPTMPSDIMTTPSQAFWTCGSASMSGELESLEMTHGQWRSLHQLENGDVIQSNNKFFVVLYTAPLYQTEQPYLAWALEPQGDGYGLAYDLQNIKETGRITAQPMYHPDLENTAEGQAQYTPYLAEVYALSLENGHHYFAGTRSFWVQQMNGLF